MTARGVADDCVDAFAVHGACGCWGVVAAALFSVLGWQSAVSVPGAQSPISSSHSRSFCQGHDGGGGGGQFGVVLW